MRVDFKALLDGKALRRRLRHPYVWLGLLLSCVVGAMVWMGTGCGGWDPRDPLMRNAPEVDEAIRMMDAGNHAQAAQLLQDYLGTEACQDGEIAVPAKARKLPDATFDLGLVLFGIGEKYGARFGDEELPVEGATQGMGEAPEVDERRLNHIDCALTVVQAIAGDRNVPAELRARAYYLAGNLEFLRKEYEKAVDFYDQALQLIPGIQADADGDPLGRDAAWNRAIALRRLEEEPDAEPPDAQPDSEPDGGDDGEQGDGGGEDEQNQDQGDDDQDAGSGEDDEKEQDAGGDEEEQPKPEPEQQDAGADEEKPGEEDQQQGPIAESGEESAEQTRMRVILEELEDAPTYQQEEAKRMRGSRARRVLEDK